MALLILTIVTIAAWWVFFLKAGAVFGRPRRPWGHIRIGLFGALAVLISSGYMTLIAMASGQPW